MFKRLSIEISLWNKGINNIAGVDEVGRGCFAGPLVCAAVVWDKNILNIDQTSRTFEILHQIKCSKKLPKNKREYLSEFIKDNCSEYTIIETSSSKIDEDGVGESNKLSLAKAAKKLKNVDFVISDYFDLSDYLNKTKCNAIKYGDDISLTIASASIIAKVYRDKLMSTKYHKLYPMYGFNTHVGYGTKKHRDAIQKYGKCPIHRNSFNIKIN